MLHLFETILSHDPLVGSARSLLTLAKHNHFQSILPIAVRVVLIGAMIAALRKGGSWLRAWLDRSTSSLHLDMTDLSTNHQPSSPPHTSPSLIRLTFG